MRYQSTPGDVGTSPPTWPESIRLGGAVDGRTLLFFAHPRCPCTRASLRELARIIAQTAGPLNVVVLLTRPASAEHGWEDGEIVRQARGMRGVRVIWDDEGTLARQFGAATSGHALVYDESRRLSYCGGLTGLRGHEGINAAQQAAASRCRESNSGVDRASVFGCALITSDTAQGSVP
jgi:hypothetical protein